MSRMRVLLFRAVRVVHGIGGDVDVSSWLSSAPVAWSVESHVGPGGAVMAAFAARISGADDVVIQRSISCWPFGGRISTSAGTVTLLNGDRGLDVLLRDEVLDVGVATGDWRDARYELRWCFADEAADVSHTWAQCRLLQAGVIDRVSTTADRRIVFALADPLARWDVPLQRAMYPGDYPNAAVRGKPLPIALGSARYVPGVLRTTDELGADAYSYGMHDGPIVGVTAAFDRGDVFALGDWDYIPDRTGIQLAGRPDRPVSAHVEGQAVGAAPGDDPQRWMLAQGVRAVAVGSFTTVGGVARNRVARLNPDGTLDTTFNPNANSTINVVVGQPDGKILIGGSFTTVGGVTRNRIARINSDGTLDTTFNPNVGGQVRAIAVQPDGKILIGGAFTTVGGVTRSYIARVNADGALDTTFAPASYPNSAVHAIAVQPDGKILIAGQFSALGSTARKLLARLSSGGTLDSAYNPDVTGTYVLTLALQSNGYLIAAGMFSAVGSTARNNIARIYPSGTVDASFDADLSSTWTPALALQPDGRVLVGGDITETNGAASQRVVRLLSSGQTDTTFAPGAINGRINAIMLQPDGKILIGGAFTTVGGVARSYIARVNADGALDSGYNPAAGGEVSSLATSAPPLPSNWLMSGVSTSSVGVVMPAGSSAATTSSAVMQAGARYTIVVDVAAVDAPATLLVRRKLPALQTIATLIVATPGVYRVDESYSAARGVGLYVSSGTVTVRAVSVVPGAPTDRLPAFVAAVADRIGASADVDWASVSTLDAAAPYMLGAYVAEPITAMTLLAQALDGWCGWAAARRDGTLFVDRLRPRGAETGTVALTTASIVSVERSADAGAGLTLGLAGRRNYTVHSDSDIAGSVDDALRADLQAEWTTRAAAPASVPSAYSHAPGADAQETLLQDSPQLQSEIDRVWSMFAAPAAWYEVDAILAGEDAESIELGDWVHVTHDSYGLSSGRWLRVMGVTIRFRSRRVSLSLLDVGG